MPEKTCRVVDGRGRPLGWLILCPGCRRTHRVPLDCVGDRRVDPGRPTFARAVRFGGCQFQVREGRIEFHPASSHPLFGRAVELPDLEFP